MDNLFFKVFKNKYIFKIIFSFVRGEIRFDDINLYYFNNRIKLSDINDLDWIVNRKQFAILKDILKEGNCQRSDQLHITGSSVTSFIQECKYDKELLKQIYTVKKEYMELVDPFKLAISFNNYTLLSLLCSGEIQTCYKLSVDNILNSIGFGNVDIFKLLFNTLKSTNLKEFNEMMNHYNLLQISISTENEDIIKYILDNIELFSGQSSTLVKHTTFNQYSCLRDVGLKNRLLNLGVIDKFQTPLAQYKLPTTFKDLSIHHLKLIIKEVNLITNKTNSEEEKEIEYYQSEVIGLFKLRTQECLVLFNEYFEMYNRFPITLSFNDIDSFKQCGIVGLMFKFTFRNLNLPFLKYLVQINYNGKEKQGFIDQQQISEKEVIEFFEFYSGQKQVVIEWNIVSVYKQLVLNESYSNSTIQLILEKLSITVDQFENDVINGTQINSFSRYKWLIENGSKYTFNFSEFTIKSIEFIDYFIENNQKELESTKYLQFDNVSLANYYQVKLNSKPTSQIYFYIYQKSIFNLDLSSVIEIDRIFKQADVTTTNEEEHDNLFTLSVKHPNDPYELINLLNYLYDSGYQNYKQFIYNEAIVNFIFTIIFNQDDIELQNKYLSEIKIKFSTTMVLELLVEFIFEKSSNINFIKFIFRNCAQLMSIINSVDTYYILSLIKSQHCLNNLEINEKTFKSTHIKCTDILSIINYLLLEFKGIDITKPIFQRLYKLLLISQDCSIFDIHNIMLLYKKYGISSDQCSLFHCFYYLNLKSPKYTKYFIDHSIDFKLKYLLDSFKSDSSDEECGIPDQFIQLSNQLPFYKIVNSSFNEIFNIIQIKPNGDHFKYSYDLPKGNYFVIDFTYLFNQREYQLLLSNTIQFISDIKEDDLKQQKQPYYGTRRYFSRLSLVDLLMQIKFQYNEDSEDEDGQVSNIILQIWQQLDSFSVYPLKSLLNLAFNNGSLYWTKFILLKLNKLNPTIEHAQLKVNEYNSYENLIRNNHFTILDFLYNNNYITTKYSTPN